MMSVKISIGYITHKSGGQKSKYSISVIWVYIFPAPGISAAKTAAVNSFFIRRI